MSIVFKSEGQYEYGIRDEQRGFRYGGIYLYPEMNYTAIHFSALPSRPAPLSVDTTDLDVLKVIIAAHIAGEKQ